MFLVRGHHQSPGLCPPLSFLSWGSGVRNKEKGWQNANSGNRQNRHCIGTTMTSNPPLSGLPLAIIGAAGRLPSQDIGAHQHRALKEHKTILFTQKG